MAESERWFLHGDRVRCIRVEDPLRDLEGTVTDTAPLIVEYDEAGAWHEDPRDVELVRAARRGGHGTMSEGKFDPGPQLIQLPGRGGKGPTDYLPVAARIAWFRAEHPTGNIIVHAHQIDERIAIFHATVTGKDGGCADGWGSETPQDFKDYIEKGSTKAIGRALAAMGYGTLQAGDELDEGARIVDTPQTKPNPRAGTTPGREPAPRSAAAAPGPTHDRPAAVPSAAGPPSSGNGKRPPTVAEALTAARNETLSAKARQYAAVRGLEACPTLDEAADYYLKVLPLAPEREALEAAYKARNEALRVEAGLPF